MDEANQHRRPQPYNRSRGKQNGNTRQPAKLNTLQDFRFAGESEDRPPPPPRDSYEQTSVVDHGRPGPPVSRQASSHPSATTPSQASRARVTPTMPTATVSSASAVMTAQAPMTVERQSLIEVEAVAGASAVPILES